MELEVDRLGIFIVTFTPKKEIFDVTPQGCLYNAHISRYISVRFPKKAHDKPFQCAIQVYINDRYTNLVEMKHLPAELTQSCLNF